MENSQFDLVRLINTVFRPKDGERVGVFIDLEDPQAVRDARFLNGANHVTRRIAYEVFYRGLLERKAELPFASVEFYAYEPTGGSNLDLPATVVDLKGRTQRLVEDVLSHLNIVLCLSTYSATAPLTAFAKKMGFRGATMHGCNETILRTGLARNYEEVSAKAERFRQALTRCDDVVLEFETLGHKYQLTLELGRQEAQKSHGLCHVPGEIANLPAGEIYWVPTGAHGQFPMRFKEDGTLALMDVAETRIRNVSLLRGSPALVQQALTPLPIRPGHRGVGRTWVGHAGAAVCWGGYSR